MKIHEELKRNIHTLYEENIVRRLLLNFPEKMLGEVFGQEEVDIDFQFCGFVDAYEHLAAMIP